MRSIALSPWSKWSPALGLNAHPSPRTCCPMPPLRLENWAPGPLGSALLPWLATIQMPANCIDNHSTATCLMYLEYDSNRVLSSGSYSYVPGVTPEWATISGTLTASATEHSFVMWGYCGTTTLHGPVLEREPTESCLTLTDGSTVTYTHTPTRSLNPTLGPTPSAVTLTSVLTTTTPLSTPPIINPSSARQAWMARFLLQHHFPLSIRLLRTEPQRLQLYPPSPLGTGLAPTPRPSHPSPRPRRLPQPLPENIDYPDHAYRHDHRLPANSDRLSRTEHLCLNRETRRVSNGGDGDSQCSCNSHRAADRKLRLHPSSASLAGAESTLTSSSGSNSGSASIPGSPSETELLTASKQDSEVPTGPGAIPPSPPVSSSAYYPTHSFSAIPNDDDVYDQPGCCCFHWICVGL
ncbi:hypothetical protein BDW60DRAFT_218957 [Aspergillus nidulans var. acristatus]